MCLSSNYITPLPWCIDSNWLHSTTSHHIWPWINLALDSVFKACEAQFQKTTRSAGYCLWCQCKKIENVTLVACERKLFRDFWAIFFVTELPHKTVFYYTTIYSVLVYSIEPRALTCLLKQSNPSAWSLLSWSKPHEYTHSWETLCFFKVVCSPPSRSRRVTEIYINTSASLERFRLWSRRRVTKCGRWAAELSSCRRWHARFLLQSHFYETKCAAGKILSRRRRQDLSIKMRRRADFWTDPDG